MTAKDRFLIIRDYIDAQNILDELESFLSDEDLQEFCLELMDYLKQCGIQDKSFSFYSFLFINL